MPTFGLPEETNCCFLNDGENFWGTQLAKSSQEVSKQQPHRAPSWEHQTWIAQCICGFVLSFKYFRWRTCTKTKSRKEECWIKCTENPTLTRHQEDCRKVHYSKAQPSTRMSVKTKRVRCVRHKDKRNEVPTPIGTASVARLHVPRHERSRPEWKQWQARTDAVLNRMSSSWSLNYAQ